MFLSKLFASRKLATLATALIFLTTAGAGVGYATLVKDVTLSVDGESSQVRGFHSTVGDVLASEDIEIGPHDLVQPGVDAQVKDGQSIVVRFGRQLHVDVDGTKTSYWTTATTLDAAIRDLGLRLDGAELSASRSQTLGRSGLALTAVLPKAVTVTVDGADRAITTTRPTVGEVLAAANVTLGKKDLLTPAADTTITPGLSIVVKRVTVERKTETVAIPFQTTEKNSSSLYKGESKTETKGVEGTKEITTEVTSTDGEVTDEKVVSEKVTKEPVTRVVLVGTKDRPRATSTGSSSSSSGTRNAGNTSGAGLNLANAAMWDRIAMCESTQRWNINTGNGYYGGLQFDYGTWLSVGGDDFAPRADLATRAEQITVANRLYAKRGLQPWGCRHAA